jgi:hypothetical protein
MKQVLMFVRILVSATLLLGCSLRSKNAEPDGVDATSLSEREWMALSKPGPSHRLLELFVGTWDAKITFRSGVDGKPEVSRGKSSVSWILGERFIKEDFEGEALGERFQGMGITGYDNAARRFTNVWIDSLNTALATSYGKYLADDNRFDFVGEIYDPLRGAMKSTRSTMHIISPNKYEFVMYDTASNGVEYRALEIEYSRR